MENKAVSDPFIFRCLIYGSKFEEQFTHLADAVEFSRLHHEAMELLPICIEQGGKVIYDQAQLIDFTDNGYYVDAKVEVLD